MLLTLLTCLNTYLQQQICKYLCINFPLSSAIQADSVQIFNPYTQWLCRKAIQIKKQSRIK